MMRFRGGGVGHKTTREATDSFKRDRDPLDDQATRAGFNDSDESDSEPDGDETRIQDGEIREEPDDGEIQEEEEDEKIQEEEEDYGYTREESEESDTDDDDAELLVGVDEVYFGPEDDGGAIDPDMDALGYAEL